MNGGCRSYCYTYLYLPKVNAKNPITYTVFSAAVFLPVQFLLSVCQQFYNILSVRLLR